MSGRRGGDPQRSRSLVKLHGSLSHAGVLMGFEGILSEQAQGPGADAGF